MIVAARERRRLGTEIKESLRELTCSTTRSWAHLQLNDADLSCLELLTRRGPLSPSALARLAGLHPATVTGVLDRLERGGWVARERDAADRRAVTVRALRDRDAELVRLYPGMNATMDEVFADYTDAELKLLAGFLRRTTEAGQQATDRLAED